MDEYIIVGDTEKHGTCLIYVCGKSKKRAEEVLKHMLETPNEADKLMMEGHTNIRIETVAKKDQWWNDPFLRN